MIMDYSKIRLADLPYPVSLFVDEVLHREGGEYTEHPHDWPTKWGIRRLSADRAGYEGEIKDITRTQAAKIWVALFWYSPNLHLVYEVSPLISKTVLDTAGPAGLRVGITHLQKALNSYNAIKSDGSHIYGDDLVIDGLIGAKTLAMLRAYQKHRSRQQGIRKLAVRLNSLQDAHYVDVALRLPKKRTFSFGWNSRRVYADLMDLAFDTDEVQVA